jgi:hypothetical protein
LREWTMQKSGARVVQIDESTSAKVLRQQQQWDHSAMPEPFSWESTGFILYLCGQFQWYQGNCLEVELGKTFPAWGKYTVHRALFGWGVESVGLALLALYWCQCRLQKLSFL